jgi:ADP-ribosylglycohydrolase
MPLPEDYAERVYAGVLGKMIGVYLGRPFEGWTYERIQRELGDIQGYVHEKLGKPLIVTDDDLSGTFAFLRALPDHGTRRDLSAAQIGETWLNYLIEKRTTLWWGGLGNSTEHTAYLRLKGGIPAPLSGSAQMNGRVVAEQIGAQIFIDGWGMVAPGDPELASSLARRAASVSHDGEAVYAAQVIAAMEALAFVEQDLERLLEAATRLIPPDSVIYRLISDLRQWHTSEPDWREARRRLEALYGYDRYTGNCHVVPNHGLVILSLLWGEDSFSKTLTIVNTCGWDTDCNSGNAGCLMGIKNGLAGIDAGPGTGQDWRGPVADRLLVISAEGGDAVTDAVREAGKIVNLGRALAGEPPVLPKGGPAGGPRFHFEAPGSVQGFSAESAPGGDLRLENTPGHSALGSRSLALLYNLPEGAAARASTPTFILPEQRDMPGYTFLAAPSLYAGQEIAARLQAGEDNPDPIACRIFVSYYDQQDELREAHGPLTELVPGQAAGMKWVLSLPEGATVYRLGLELLTEQPARGALYLDSFDWSAPAQAVLADPLWEGEMWRRAWVDGVDRVFCLPGKTFRVIQDRGRGLAMTGTCQWQDYRFTARVTPHLAAACGIAVRVQGLRRYYALLLCRGEVLRLVRACGEETILGEMPLPWEFWQPVSLSLQVTGQRLRAWVDEQLTFDVVNEDGTLDGGGVGLVIEEGCLAVERAQVDAGFE